MNWSTDRTAARRRWLFATLGALGLHVAVLGAIASVRPRVMEASPPAPVVQFRFTRPAAAQSAGPAEARKAVAVPTPAAPAARAAASSPSSDESPGAGKSDSGPGPSVTDDLESYRPRRELSEPPTPFTAPNLVFPETPLGTVDLTVKVTLYIDEHGSVRHLRIDTPNVHPAFALAIQDTFLGLPFSPGAVDGEPVRSRMRLEIEFSNIQRARKP